MIDFIYYPDRAPSESWFRLLLRETGLDIWIEMLHDEFFVDTTDDLNRTAFASALRALALSNQQSDAIHRNSSDACEVDPSSAEANCDIENDLLSSGWTIPNSTSALRNEVSGGPLLSGQGTFGQGNPYPEDTRSILALQAYVAMLVDLAVANGCCGGEAPGFEGDIGSLGQPVGSLGQPAGDTNVPDDTNPVSTVYSGTSAGSGPAMIPEPSISYLLLIGVGGLVLATRKRLSGRFRIA